MRRVVLYCIAQDQRVGGGYGQRGCYSVCMHCTQLFINRHARRRALFACVWRQLGVLLCETNLTPSQADRRCGKCGLESRRQARRAGRSSPSFPHEAIAATGLEWLSWSHGARMPSLRWRLAGLRMSFCPHCEPQAHHLSLSRSAAGTISQVLKYPLLTRSSIKLALLLFCLLTCMHPAVNTRHRQSPPGAPLPTTVHYSCIIITITTTTIAVSLEISY